MNSLSRLGVLAAGLISAGLLAGPSLAASDVTVNDARVFPESMTALADGTVIVGSLNKPIIYRAGPGQTRAEPWIQLAGDDVVDTLGVLADPKFNTLWVCGLAAPASDPLVKRHSILKTFDLKTGAAKASYPLPGPTNVCNDITVAVDGTAYVSDTYNGRIFRLKRGGALEVWLTDPLLTGIDGLTLLGPTLYVDNITTRHIYRIPMDAAGKAGAPVDIVLSQPLGRPDGLRATGRRLFVAENGSGRVSELKLEGDKATVVAIREGFATPTAVQAAGDTLWVGESKLAFFHDPKTADQDPGPFKIFALPLPK